MKGPTQGGSYVVSPYLHEPSVQDPDGILDFIDDAEAARVRSGDFTILFDVLDDRIVVVPQVDANLLAQLRQKPDQIKAYCAREPAAFERMRSAGLLVDEDDIVQRHAFRSIEVEINRHCNYRCEFCPVANTPKPKSFMLPDVYAVVLERVVEYGAKTISLNHYSEPTLDRDLLGKIEAARRLGLSVRLFTNASKLTEPMIRKLAEMGNTRIVVNLPSLDPVEYARVTKTKLLDRVLSNLELLYRNGVTPELSINTPRGSADTTVKEINDRLEGWFGKAVRWPTDDRGGRLDAPQYVVRQDHSGRLSGCIIALNDLSVTFEGKAFLCCQDFDQRYVLGDLRTQTIREVAEGKRAVALRRMLLGLDEPEQDLICSKCAWTRPLNQTTAKLSVWSENKLTDHGRAEFMRRGRLVWAVSDQSVTSEAVPCPQRRRI